jgi:phosphate starvation-inducible protein PhoH
MDFHEINTMMTRLGQNSRIIFVGDTRQNDLRNKKYDISGMQEALNVARRMPDFGMVEFLPEDIVRSEFVKRWIMACESSS